MKIYIHVYQPQQFGNYAEPHQNFPIDRWGTRRFVSIPFNQIENTKYLKKHAWTTISMTKHKRAYPELMALVLSGEVEIKEFE